MSVHSEIQRITDRIIERSAKSRSAYVSQMKQQFDADTTRSGLHCGNLAHAFAGCGAQDKAAISEGKVPNLGIITAYNDMLSAHKPFETYPEMIREFAQKHKAVAQVAGAVPAMCDGVTQGQVGMELSLYSRDVIALATTIGLSHNMFEGVINLGICDKIVPGLLIGNLKFGDLHALFMPGGPMESGISNEEKARIRRDYAEGKIDRATLLKGESDSYHSPGTCTFYGTANSNQMMMEIMGLQLPGSSFVNPGTELRTLLNEEAVKTLVEMIAENDFDRTISQIVSEKTIVNGIIGLLATGGSTNHTIHLIAIAKAAGIVVDWTDFSELSKVIPLLTRVYPNGAADVNHFHASGGMGFVMRTLLEAGLLHEDVNTILGKGLNKYKREPKIKDQQLIWVDAATETLNESILRSAQHPFSPEGGITMLEGNIGRSVMKKSAVDPEHHIIEAEAIVFNEQEDLIAAFKNDELNRDFVAILPFQGPQQNGMPELHQLTPTLTILQKRGHRVALVTDGRMSGASGKVPSAIHVTPEARCGGIIGKIRTGDIVLVDATNGILECKAEGLLERTVEIKDNSTSVGTGRELFGSLRQIVSSSEEGASFIL